MSKRENIRIGKKHLLDLLDFIDGCTIPYYQRTYNWTKIEIERLIYDLINNESDEYFCGNVILYSKFQDLTIVDGQQRISTFLLFVKAFSNWKMEFETNKFDVKNYKIKSQNLKDKEVLQQLLNAEQKEINKVCENYASSQYVINFKLINNYLENLKIDEREKFIKRFYNLTLSLVVIGDEYDEYRLFTNINSTGLPLNAFDLVKNLMLSKLDLNSDEDINKYLNKLHDISSYLEFEKNKAKILNELVRLFISFKTGKVENNESTMLFRKFEELFKSQYGGINMEKLFEDFYHFGLYFKFIKTKEIYRYKFYLPFRMIEILFDTFSSLVIDILTKHSMIKESKIVFDEQNIRDIFKNFLVLEIYICSRVFLRKRSNDLTRFIPSLIRNIKNDERNISYAAKLLSHLLDPKGGKEENNVVMPNKRDFYMVLANSNVYDGNGKYLTALLIRINEHIDNNSKYDLINIEHVMPQNITEWEGNGFEISDIDFNHYLNTIGNLTIVAAKLNSTLSNKPFNEKKQDLLLKDSFMINNYFNVKQKWDVEEIKLRTKKIIKEYLENIYNIDDLYQELGMEIEKIEIDDIINYPSYFETSTTKSNTRMHYSNLRHYQRKGMNLNYDKVCKVIYMYCVENKNLPEISAFLHQDDRSSLTAHGILNLLDINTSKTSSYRNKNYEWYQTWINENKLKIENLLDTINH